MSSPPGPPSAGRIDWRGRDWRLCRERGSEEVRVSSFRLNGSSPIEKSSSLSAASSTLSSTFRSWTDFWDIDRKGTLEGERERGRERGRERVRYWKIIIISSRLEHEYLLIQQARYKCTCSAFTVHQLVYMYNYSVHVGTY